MNKRTVCSPNVFLVIISRDMIATALRGNYRLRSSVTIQ